MQPKECRFRFWGCSVVSPALRRRQTKLPQMSRAPRLLGAAVWAGGCDPTGKADNTTYRGATADAAYRAPDTATSYGQMWGYRWAKALGVKVDGRLEPNPPAWVSEYGKVGK
jgi:hypothetical protein